jgi:hypothetical protein
MLVARPTCKPSMRAHRTKTSLTINLTKPSKIMIVISIQLKYHPELAPCFFQFTEGDNSVTGMISGECVMWNNLQTWPFMIDKDIAEELILTKYTMFLNRDNPTELVVS